MAEFDPRASGARMAERRMALHLSQQALADLLGVSQAVISQQEADGLQTLKLIERVATALECEPCWLAYGMPVSPKKRQSA